MTAPLATCICGHSKPEHIDGTGECNEPTYRCECQFFLELCSVCRHSTGDHDGIEGRCTRTVQKTRQPCGCTAHPTPLEGS